MSVLEKIKSFYEIENKYGILRIKKGEDKKYLTKDDQPTYFTFGKNVPPERLDEEAEKGNIIKTTGFEIYKEYFNWDEDTCHKERYGYSKRTKAYLDGIKNKLGFVKSKYDYEFEELTAKEEVGYRCSIGKTKDGLWCYQQSIRTDIDDYTVEKLYFNRKPSKKAVETMQSIIDLENNFYFQHLKEVFTCWECGRDVHWLDVDGDFNTKANALFEKYCGC
jgi:hypothetical protein